MKRIYAGACLILCFIVLAGCQQENSTKNEAASEVKKEKKQKPEITKPLTLTFDELSFQDQKIEAAGSTNLPDGTNIDIELYKKGETASDDIKTAYQSNIEVKKGKFSLTRIVETDPGTLLPADGAYYIRGHVVALKGTDEDQNTPLLKKLDTYNVLKEKNSGNPLIKIGKPASHQDEKQALDIVFTSKEMDFDNPEWEPAPVKEEAEAPEPEAPPEKTREERIREIAEDPDMQALMEEYDTTAECLYLSQENMYDEYEARGCSGCTEADDAGYDYGY